MKKLKEIPVNIWDDYYEDGYVPDGEIQKTSIYIEEYDYLSSNKHKEYLEFLLNYIKENINIENVDFNSLICKEGEDTIYRIEVKHLTHTNRLYLLNKLREGNLEMDNLKFNFYSES